MNWTDWPPETGLPNKGPFSVSVTYKGQTSCLTSHRPHIHKKSLKNKSWICFSKSSGLFPIRIWIIRMEGSMCVTFFKFFMSIPHMITCISHTIVTVQIQHDTRPICETSVSTGTCLLSVWIYKAPWDTLPWPYLYPKDEMSTNETVLDSLQQQCGSAWCFNWLIWILH